MAFAKGDVVLVPFPFTDLTAARVRPALVVSSEQYNDVAGDVIVAMVTSREHDAPTDYSLRDWQSAGLIYPSWVRATLATLEQRLIQFSPGRLTMRDLRAVEIRLRRALGL